MTNSRTIEISLDHLAAEVAACPLVLPESYQYAITHLCGNFQHIESLQSGNCSNAQKYFWRAAEQYFLARFPHTGIDELVGFRNLFWFHQESSRDVKEVVPLRSFLERLARQYLKSTGTEAVPQLPPSKSFRGGLASSEPPEPAARRAWRWMTFSLPADLLLAALDDGNHRPTEVSILSPTLAGLLREGFAETHLHYGVAFDFQMAWAATMYAAGGRSDCRLEWNSYCSPGAANEEGRNLAVMVVRAALVRYFLAAYLYGQRNQRNPEKFESWLQTKLQSGFPGIPSSDPKRIVSTIRDLENGFTGKSAFGLTPQQTFAGLQGLYIRWTKVSGRALPGRLSDVQLLDPLSSFFPAGSSAHGSVQLQFLVAGFSHLRRASGDRLFETLFWQVERVRCMLYRHCIQRPLTPGLTNFVRFYDRKKPLARPLEKVLLDSAAELSGRGRGLKSLEIRTSPCRDAQVQRKELRNIRDQLSELRSSGGTSQLETGLVLHFLKFRGSDFDKGLPLAFDKNSHADPANRKNPGGYRWSKWFFDCMRQAKAIGTAIRREPELLRVLRGIDVCRDEAGVPTWVVAPLFTEVRRQINDARLSHRRRTGDDLPPLRTTVHVGEDFVHLASGIRMMDEAVQFLHLTSGDRVGHGLALGVDALAWARKTDRLVMPREDRLFDLIWEKGWHAAPEAKFSCNRQEFVTQEIEHLARAIFFPDSKKLAPSNLAAREMMEFCRDLFDFSELKRLRFPSGELPIEPPKGKKWILSDYLTDARVYARSRAVEWVEADQDGEAVAELQRLVRRRYAAIGITVEVNPISNLLVGDLTDLDSHPLWRLAPRLGDSCGPSMRMCIGSDDPFVFSTNLPEEYQFLADSLVFAGKSHAEAREWLDLLRRMGLESRFTV